MTNQLQVFQSPEFGQIRTLEIDGAIFFVGVDVCNALGYSNSRKAIADHVDPEDVTKRDALSNGGIQSTTVINESGLYSLILSSKLPTAKKFKRWVTSEILPSIRKHGFYGKLDFDSQIKAFDSDVNLLKTAGILADTLIQSFQVEEGIARTSVLDMLEDRFNRDFSKIKEILPPAKSSSALLTPTQIGEQFDPAIKPYNVNLWLEHCNLQINISGKWDPTELGKQFAQRTAFTSKASKHADLQLKWKFDVIDFLRQHPCPVEILNAKRSRRKR